MSRNAHTTRQRRPQAASGETHAVALLVTPLIGLVAGMFLLAGLVSADGAVTPGSRVPDGPADKLRVEIADDLVTLMASDVAIQDILDSIADRTDLLVVTQYPLQRPISVEFSRLPLFQALERILRGESFALRNWGAVRDAGNSGRTGPRTVRVFSSGIAYGNVVSGSSDSRIVTSGAAGDAVQFDMTSPDRRLRQRAVRGLRRLDADEAVTPLSLALSDENEKVRMEAVQALVDVGGEAAAALLTSALSDESAGVREEAAYALGMIGGDAAIDMLEAAMYDADRDVRESAIDAYSDIGTDRAARALTIALYDADTELREEAVYALGDIGGPTAAQILRLAFEDQDSGVRSSAIDALRDIGGDDAARSLAVALNDTDLSVRLEAIEALADIGGPSAIDALERVRDDPDAAVQSAAAETLAELSRQ